MHRQNIEKIILTGTVEQMQDLKDVLIWIIDELRDSDKSLYYESEMCIHEILYGKHLSKELAECWVKKMCNKDGTKGQHWTYEQVEKVMKEKDIKINIADFYAVLNMVWSDFYNPKFDLGVYLELAKDWLEDEDVPAGKALRYYYRVVHE